MNSKPVMRLALAALFSCSAVNAVAAEPRVNIYN